MTAHTLTNTRTQVDAAYETSQLALAAGITVSALAGIWGCACLISALVQNGPLGLLQGYVTALLG